MRDRKLTGPWAGFSFKGDRLVTPEGREIEPHHLAWLSLTACMAREWSTLMDETRKSRSETSGKPCGSGRQRKRISSSASNLVYLRDHLRRTYEERSTGGDASPDAVPVRARR